MALIPIANLPFKYANSCRVTAASNTTLTITSGQFRDSTNVCDLQLTSTQTLDTAVVGVNGLDTGVLVASSVYAVYLIGSSANKVPTRTIASLSFTQPYLPANYDIFAIVDYQITDSSVHFLANYTAGNNAARTKYWDTMQSVLSGGTATSLTEIDLSAFVPAVDYTPVIVEVSHTPAGAGGKVSFTPYGSTATVIPNISGAVAAVAQTGQLRLISRLNASSHPVIKYINSAGAGATSVWVYGYEYFV